MLLDTDYYYQEGWQYQTIQVNVDTLDIIRSQNYKINGEMQHSVDTITVNDKDWYPLFKRWGYKALIKYKEEIECYNYQ